MPKMDYVDYKNVVATHIQQISNCKNSYDLVDKFDGRVNSGWRFGDLCIEVAKDIIKLALD